jgi:hypothetical protein
MYTLIVFIFTLGSPSSIFYVDGYNNIADCTEGYKIAHQMSIDPTSQSIKADCIPTEEWNQIKTKL